MNSKREKRKGGFSDSPAYKELVADLSKIIAEARAQGVDFGGRDDILTCRGCGAHEDITHEGAWEVRAKDKQLTGHERFIILDTKERSCRRNKARYFKHTHTFICPVCGLQQEQIVLDRFEDD